MKILKKWDGDMRYITIGKAYTEEVNPDDLYFKDDEGVLRSSSLAEWEGDITEEHTEDLTEEHTGGSSSYYDLKVGDTTIKCLDIIEGLGMSYNEGNILKAVWRIAAAKQGKTKKGNNMHYDSEKIVFFGERLVEEHKEDV